jgi:hypothetical protein
MMMMMRKRRMMTTTTTMKVHFQFIYKIIVRHYYAQLILKNTIILTISPFESASLL